MYITTSYKLCTICICSTAKFKLILTYTHVCYERCTLGRHRHCPRSSLNFPPPFFRLSFWVAFFSHCFCMSTCNWYSWEVEWHWITCLMCIRFRLWLSLRLILRLLILNRLLPTLFLYVNLQLILLRGWMTLNNLSGVVQVQAMAQLVIDYSSSSLDQYHILDDDNDIDSQELPAHYIEE